MGLFCHFKACLMVKTGPHLNDAYVYVPFTYLEHRIFKNGLRHKAVN